MNKQKYCLRKSLRTCENWRSLFPSKNGCLLQNLVTVYRELLMPETKTRKDSRRIADGLQTESNQFDILLSSVCYPFTIRLLTFCDPIPSVLGFRLSLALLLQFGVNFAFVLNPKSAVKSSRQTRFSITNIH